MDAVLENIAAASSGLMNQAQYARHRATVTARSCSKQYINKLVTAGTIPTDRNGLIDPIKADEILTKESDPARRMVMDAKAAAAAPASEYAPAGGQTEQPGYSKHRADAAFYESEMKRLAYLEKIGKSLDADEVLDAKIECGRLIAQAVDNIVSWTDEICALTPGIDPAVVRGFLRGKSRDLRQTISDLLSGAVSEKVDDEV